MTTHTKVDYDRDEQLSRIDEVAWPSNLDAAEMLSQLPNIDYRSDSFEAFLRRWCKILQPKRILEWGPGKSTGVLHEAAPDAYILSIENVPGYAQQMAAAHPYADVACCPFQSTGPTDYSYLPVKEEPFDLTFVDGRRRSECLLSATKCTETGIVILHDCYRPQYRPGLSLYNVVEAASGCAVLTLRSNG